MTRYTVAVTAELDRPIDDAAARDLAARWAATLKLDPGCTSVDALRLAVSGTFDGQPDVGPEGLAYNAALELDARVWMSAGCRVARWHAVEIVSEDELIRRAAGNVDAVRQAMAR